jgi:hypothetical protein
VIQPPGRSPHQFDPDLALDRREHAAHRLERASELARCAREAAVLDHRHEGA